MAKRKTAGRAGTRKNAARTKAARPASARGRATKKTRRTSGASQKRSGRTTATGRSVSARKAAPKGSATGGKKIGTRQSKRLDEVTDEVQRRWDLEEEDVPTPPSTLDLDRHASAARTGHVEMIQRRRKHTAASPAITGGDVDADWEGAYFVGDESATGDNPTPDQGAVEDIGHAVGVDYEDTEELKSTPKIDRRDKKRWELDPASSEDYPERNRKRER